MRKLITNIGQQLSNFVLFRDRRILWASIIVLSLFLYAESVERHPAPAMQGEELHQPQSINPLTNETLRISTYNIYRGRGLDKRGAMDDVIKTLSNDDIVAIQEVGFQGWPVPIDQAEFIARKIGLAWLFAPIQTRGDDLYIGNALLTRVPINKWSITPLVWSNDNDNPKQSRRYRNRIVAKAKIAEKEVVLINTHLDRGPIRHVQLRNLLEEIDRYPRVIAMGDLNTIRDDPILSDWLKKHPGADALATDFDQHSAGPRIDWIIVKGFEVLDKGMIPAGISDHPYFWAEVRPL